METRLKKIIETCYLLLIIVTPLIMFHKTSELFEFNKMLFIYLVAFIILSTTIFRMILKERLVIPKTPLNIPLFLLFLSLLASTVFSIDVHTSIFGYYSRFNGGLSSIIAYIMLFYCFLIFILEEAREERNLIIKKFLTYSLLSSAAVIVWGLPGKIGFDLTCFVFTGVVSNACWTDQFHPEERMFSTIGQPNWLGAYVVILFFIGLYYFFNISKSRQNSLLITSYLFLNVSALLFTRSRSALIALLVGLFLLLIYLKRRVFVDKKMLYFLILIIAVPIILFQTGISKIDRVLRFQVSTPKQELKSEPVGPSLNITESFDIRKIVWQGAFELGARYPFFGTGNETFAYAYPFVRPKEHNLTSEWDFIYNKAHNEYLNYLATTGFLGLGTYLFFIIAVILLPFNTFRQTERNIKKVALQQSASGFLVMCLLISWITILITNFFGFSTTTINIYFYLIPALIVILTDQASLVKVYDLASISKKKVTYAIPAAILGFGIWFVVSYFLADISYAASERYNSVQDYKSAQSHLKKALFWKSEHVYQDKLSFALSNAAFVYTFSPQSEEKKDTEKQTTIAKLVEESDYFNKQSLLQSPKNVLYWKTRAKNYFIFFQLTEDNTMFTKAEEALEFSQKLSPTDPKLLYTQALFYQIKLDSKNKLSDEDKKHLLRLSI